MKKIAVIILALLAIPYFARAQTAQFGPIPFNASASGIVPFPASASGTATVWPYPPQTDTLGITVAGLGTTSTWTLVLATSPDQTTWTTCETVTLSAAATTTATCSPQGGTWLRITVTAGSGGGNITGSVFGQNSKIGSIGGGGSYTLPAATTTVLGGVKPDGTTCITVAGVLTCPTGVAGTPGATDDAAHGATLTNPYWIDLSTKDTYQLLSATTGSAEWARQTPTLLLPVDAAGSSVKAAYSLYKIKASYTGNCCILTRASDSTTVTLAYINGFVDVATAANFCQGTTCNLTTWYDQSGNANNCTQTTAADGPYWGLDNLGNAPTLTFEDVSGGGSTYNWCVIPTTVAITNPNLTMIAVAQPQRISGTTGTNDGTFINLGPNSSNQGALDTFVNGAAPYYAATEFIDPSGTPAKIQTESGPAVFAVIQNSSATQMWLNESEVTGTPTGNTQAFTGGQIGYESLYGSGFAGDISTVIIGNAALSAAQRQATWNSLYLLHGISPQYAMNNWVAIGDSITQGYVVTGGLNYPTNVGKQISTRIVNNGIAGIECSQIATNFANYTAPLKSSTARNNVASLLCGANDIVTGGDTAAAVWASIQTIISDSVAAGMPMTVMTVLPMGSSYEATRTALNTLIRNGAVTAGAKSVCDFAASPIMGQAGQDVAPYYEVDGLHPTALGQSVLAGIALGCVQPLLTQ